MLIALNKILKRNKSNLVLFIEKNKLTSYDDLIEYCKRRRFIPCTEDEYKKAVGTKNTHEEKLGREASKPQKKRKTRTSRKGK